MLLISAGFDSRVDDPLGDFQLSDDDFSELTTLLCKQADTFCEGRVVSLLEGGYNVDVLPLCVAEHLTELLAADAK